MEDINDSLKKFLSKSEQIGDSVAEIARKVEGAFLAHLDIVALARQFKKPNNDQLKDLLKKISANIVDIDEFRQRLRTHPMFNHLATIAESAPAFGWVSISPTPGPYVKEMIDAAQFYANKVLVAYKDKDKLHVEWVHSWIQFLQGLHKYILQHHTTGLTWNQRGPELSSNNGGQAAPPPPPPMGAMPPPPPPMAMDIMTKTDLNADARAALLKDLNQGTDITKTLRKVTLDDKRQLTTPMSDRSVSRSKSPEPRSVSAASHHQPKFEFEGRKWLVEYQDGSKQDSFTINITEMNQVVNVFKCENITIIVKGKTNSITVDSCKKVNLAFDDIVSFVEFINCQKIQAYPTGKVATITIDKTDSIQLFLRKDSLNAEIISAKSAEINACIVDESTGDYKEYPLSEQLKTTWSGNQFKTEALPKA